MRRTHSKRNEMCASCSTQLFNIANLRGISKLKIKTDKIRNTRYSTNYQQSYFNAVPRAKKKYFYLKTELIYNGNICIVVLNTKQYFKITLEKDD